MRMLGNMGRRCPYGCCRSTAPSGRDAERRWLKRSERQQWRRRTGEQVDWVDD